MLQATGGRFFAADSGVFYIQNLGVIIFFLISGYIVTKTSIPKAQHGSYNVVDFTLDRGTRILVPFIPAAIGIYVLDHLFFQDDQMAKFQDIHLNLPTLAANITLLFDNPILTAAAKLTHHPALQLTRIGTGQPFWTVVIEWWIYVAFGMLAIQWTLRRRFGLVGFLVFGFAVLYPLANLMRESGLVLAWVFGSLYCVGERRVRALPRAALAMIVLASLAMAAVALVLFHFNLYNPIFVCLFSAGFLFGHAVLDDYVSDGRRKMPRIFNLWSDYSYSIYLVHFSLITYLEILRPAWMTPAMAIVTAWLLANIVAFAYWKLIETRYPVVRAWVHGLRRRERHAAA